MSAEASLSDTIESALASADWLILLASPAAATSQWVGKEVAWWLEHKDPASILFCHCEGRLAWQDKDFSPDSDAIPPMLRGRGVEPRWVDLTWFDEPGSARAKDPRFTHVVQQLTAPMLGVPREEIGGVAALQHRRTMRTAAAAIAVLAVLLVVALVAGSLARINGDRARAQLRVATSQQLAAQSTTLQQTDIATARQLAVGAYKLSDNSQTRAALLGAALASDALDTSIPLPFEPVISSPIPGGTSVAIASPDGRVALIDIPGRSVRELATATTPGTPTCLSTTPDGNTILICGSQEPGSSTLTVLRHRDAVFTVTGAGVSGAVASDGTALITRSNSTFPDSTTAVFRLDPTATDPVFLRSMGNGTVTGVTSRADGFMLAFGHGADRCYLSIDESGSTTGGGYVHVPVETYIVSREPIHPVLDATGNSYAVVGIGPDDDPSWRIATGQITSLNLPGDCVQSRESSSSDQQDAITIGQKPTAIAMGTGGELFAMADGGTVAVVRAGSQGRPQEEIHRYTGTGSIHEGMLFMPSPDTVLSIAEDTANIWSTRTGGALVSTVDVPRDKEALGQTYCTGCSAERPSISPDGAIIVVSARDVSTWFNLADRATATFSGRIVRWESENSAIAVTERNEWFRVVDGVVTEPAEPSALPEAGSVGGGWIAEGWRTEGFKLTHPSKKALHVESVVPPVISPDGSVLAHVTDDERLVLTHIATSSEIARIDVAGERVRKGSIAFADNNRRVVFDKWDLDGNSIVTVIDLDPEIWMAQACSAATGPLSREALADFIPGNELTIETCPAR